MTSTIALSPSSNSTTPALEVVLETPEGHVARYAIGTNRVVGLTVLGARRILAREGYLAVTIPETVETTAEDLAPALAAV